MVGGVGRGQPAPRAGDQGNRNDWTIGIAPAANA